MQNHSHYMTGVSSNTVLIVEYYKQQAKVVGREGDLNEWTKWSAFRHHGDRMNVLFEDGHVSTVVKPEIDPRLPEVYRTTWLPHIDPDR
jgi:prepilin-type processing-associated H-X9-DG protein